jgi:hypothetical protein
MQFVEGSRTPRTTIDLLKILGVSECSPMSTPDFFRSRLDAMIDLRHPLAVLATKMSWSSIETTLASCSSDAHAMGGWPSNSNRAPFCCRTCPVHRSQRPCWSISGFAASTKRFVSTPGSSRKTQDTEQHAATLAQATPRD